MSIEFYIASLPVFLIGLYIYKKDTEKEPLKLLAKLLGCGAAAAVCTLIFSLILSGFIPFLKVTDINTLSVFERIIYIFVGIAFIEEGFKYLFLYKYGYNNKEFDFSFDMIVYATFVSLGFALFENLLYDYEGGVGLGIFRAVTSIPLHATCGIFMGAFLSVAKHFEINKLLGAFKNKFLALLTPVLIHGIYDYLVMQESTKAVIAFIVFIICVDIITIKFVNQKSREDKKFI